MDGVVYTTTTTKTKTTIGYATPVLHRLVERVTLKRMLIFILIAAFIFAVVVDNAAIYTGLAPPLLSYIHWL